jgi:hypothetical protein
MNNQMKELGLKIDYQKTKALLRDKKKGLVKFRDL